MAVDISSLAPNTPIIVGAGQSVERHVGTTSHLGMAARAAAMAVSDCGGDGVPEKIDTICVIRLFSDSAPSWKSELGRSNNPPESIATAIGASPHHRIYAHAGGNEPQALLMEFLPISRGAKGTWCYWPARKHCAISARPSNRGCNWTGMKSSQRHWKTGG